MKANKTAQLKNEKPAGVRGAISRICTVLFVAVLVFVILVAGSVLAAQGLGYKPMAILSGSMEPAYNVNGLVFINTNVQAEEIKVGDVISFELNEATTVTHRVTEVDAQARQFTTKGDANDTADGPVGFDAFVGKAGLHIPHLGGLALGIRSTKGIAIGLLTLAFLIILFVVPILIAPAKKDGEEQKRERMAKSGALL
jgi:signal peptidase